MYPHRLGPQMAHPTLSTYFVHGGPVFFQDPMNPFSIPLHRSSAVYGPDLGS